jgi:uncharacterized protein
LHDGDGLSAYLHHAAAGKLHKDVLTQLSTLVALGVTSRQDRDAIKPWVDGNADRDQARKVYESLAALPVGEGWIWAPDHNLLKHVRFPAIHTLDTSKTPKAGDARITAPVLASADVVKITRQIEAIEATQSSKAKHPTKAGAKTHLARAQAQPTVASSPKQTITAPPLQIGAAIVAARTAAGLSQNELASRTKTAQPNIGRLEEGGSLPSVRALQRIAKATGHKLIISFIPTT